MMIAIGAILLFADLAGAQSGPQPPVGAATRPPVAPPSAAGAMDAAIAAIDRARATVVSASETARRGPGPITTARLLDRLDDAEREARGAATTLAAALGEHRLTGAQQRTVPGQIARANRVSAAAAALGARIGRTPAARLEREASVRVGSPLGWSFWQAAARALPDDANRLSRFLTVQADATWHGLARSRAWVALLGLLAAVLLILPVGRALRQVGRRFMVDRIPQSRLRRSGWALWTAVLGTAIPSLAVLALYGGFRAAGMVSGPWQPFADGVIRAVAIGAAVVAVAGALLQRRQPSWRLLPVSDATAGEVRPWTILAALAVFATVVIDELLAAAAISLPSRDAATVFEAVLQTAANAAVLIAVTRARRRADAVADAQDAQRSAVDGGGAPVDDDLRRRLIATALLTLLGWTAVLATALALAIGYVALARLIAGMLIWLPLIAAALYLCWAVVDDLANEMISGGSALGRSLHRALGVRTSVVDQVGVSLSALLRIVLLLVAVTAAFMPFGSNFGQLGALAGTIGRGVVIGQITIAPGAILRGLVVLAIGLFIVRLAERWLTERYLPKTELDEGARNSISTVVRYLGLMLAFAWALGALGIGFERIALMLSALSVGIGFGLQAITQNFVSGLILLIERPVKIGDLVEVGGRKGDVKKISVRATEIQTSDRSTLIVPNSELITKTVRNMTHADPMGVIELKFTVPIDTDVAAVRELVMTLFHDAETVFDDPVPKVFIDSIDDGAVHFNCTAYCSSPRAAYATRSEVLFRLIGELRQRGIAIGTSNAAAVADTAASAPGSSGVIGDDEN